jgi:hypothetical protein
MKTGQPSASRLTRADDTVIHLEQRVEGRCRAERSEIIISRQGCVPDTNMVPKPVNKEIYKRRFVRGLKVSPTPSTPVRREDEHLVHQEEDDLQEAALVQLEEVVQPDHVVDLLTGHPPGCLAALLPRPLQPAP